MPGCPPGTKVSPEPQETPWHESQNSLGNLDKLMCRADGMRAPGVMGEQGGLGHTGILVQAWVPHQEVMLALEGLRHWRRP